MSAPVDPDSSKSDAWKGTSDEELESFIESRKSLIKVFGVGGGGSNTVDRLFREKLEGVDLIACNTDARHLRTKRANYKIVLGVNLTRGLGAGTDPRTGEAAALESENEILEYARGTEIAFVVTGLGGGTGTGAAPVIAKILKEHGALTIGVATLPFRAEGEERKKNAAAGFRKLRDSLDTMIVVPNDKLRELNPDLPLKKGFEKSDEIVIQAIRSIIEIIRRVGKINLDYNDLKEIVRNSREAVIGVGVAQGEAGTRAREAAHAAMNSPFLSADLSQASGVIVTVTGGSDLEKNEPSDAVNEIKRNVSRKTRILMGLRIDDSFVGTLQVTVVIAGVSYTETRGFEQSGEPKSSVDLIK
ncbi:MAG: cell division protein FtsZ [Candidatus Thermoplasmatota archaeon]|nr:cell division protein FtsZ [Candidatus Thermoplasmatota archaeon]MCL5785706.1 cell division protein FtsZ [Candidatus Thermoplasmatota archaeon]